MSYDYFYDQQIRRYLLQIVRAFSGFQYQIGGRNGGQPTFMQVPCKMAMQNRQMGHIMNNNSENAVQAVPMITVWIKEMTPARDRTQNPSHVSTVQVVERAVDLQGNYTGERGNGYTVERLMPHPVDMMIQVDIWTSNEHQKHQIWEQIYMAFNVGFDIQSSENPLDWSSLTTMEMISTTWSSRAIPIGGNDEIDVASFNFKVPIWMNPPAKVKQQKLIHQIVANIREGGTSQVTDPLGDVETYYDEGAIMSRQIITPKNARIRIEGNEITLLTSKGLEMNDEGQPMSWAELIKPYGMFKPAESQLRLRADIEQEIELDIVGTIQLHPNKPNVMLWQVDLDTLPSNTLDPINGLVNPLNHFPGSDINGRDGVLESAQEGQRYLILADLGKTVAWGTLANAQGATQDGQGNPITAYAGDIIEYRSGRWTIVFDAESVDSTHYLVNLKSGKQLRFTDHTWILAVDGEYHPGFWRLSL